MTVDPAQLAAFRAALGERHRRQPSAESAFELARAAWLAGDYDESLARFRESHACAPDEPSVALALARAASGLGRHDIETAALNAGLSRHPDDPGLILHAALREIPGDLEAARRRLRAGPNDPTNLEFASALDDILAGQPPAVRQAVDERAAARAAGARWVQARTQGPDVFRGLPVAVLAAGLEAATVDGLVLEFGVYHGRSLRTIAAASPGEVHGFDSFQGLPEAWSAAEGAGAYSTAGRRPAVPANVALHAGWFEDTLPPFMEAHPGPVRLAHVDCDLYSSTRTVLAGLADRFVPGSVLVFDDLLGYPGFEQHELRAFEEFVAATGTRYEIIAATLLGREVAVRIVG